MNNISKLKKLKTYQLTTFNLEKRSKTIDVPRGKKVTLGEVKGHGCIKQLWLTFPGWFYAHWEPSLGISQSILKTLILRIYWDGSDKPAVQCPVGDFFGNGLCEISNFTSKYFGMSSGGFFCKFPMPFKKGFRIEMENLDENVDTDVFLNVLYHVDEKPPENVGYFHALFQTKKHKGPEPVEIADVNNTRGHLVGCSLSMQAEERNYLGFLEAPEYIYIDDDTDKPTIVGTGLEDYFLGGWYFREGCFAGELHGVPSKDSLNSSIAMYRIHDDDAIYFNKKLRFKFINPFSAEKLKPFACSSCAFFYLDTPEGQSSEIPSREELLCWYRVKNTDHQSIP